MRALLPAAAPEVVQWLLLTRDLAGAKPDPVRGVPVAALRTTADALRAMPRNALTAVRGDRRTRLPTRNAPTNHAAHL